MDEAQIAASLQARLSKPEAVKEPVAEAINTDISTIQVDMPLEPMLGYKLADVFRVNFEPKDNVMTERMKFVYDEVSKTIGSTEYMDVAQYIRSLVEMLGAQSTQDTLYTVYQWMKLDSNRKKIEEEMKLYAHWS